MNYRPMIRRCANTLFIVLALLGLGYYALIIFIDFSFAKSLQSSDHNQPNQQTEQITEQQETPEILLQDIILPAPPTEQTEQIETAEQPQSATQTAAPEVTEEQPVEQITEPKIEQKAVQPQAKKEESVVQQPVTKPKTNAQIEPVVAKPEVQPKQQAQDIYQQLHNNAELDIQLAWPQSSWVRNQLLDYLYRCAGAQFAVLNGQQLTYLSPGVKSQPSRWIRVAQGKLSRKENIWLSKYKDSGTAVRLFPLKLDMALSKQISNTLGNQPLKSLRARYQLRGNKLQLTKIQLNGQSITRNWTIHNSYCSI